MTGKNAYTKEDLIACGHGKLFGPGNAQLPVDNMLMMDRITHISSEGGEYGKGEIIAELDVHPDLWFFSCHFPGDPVMPGCLGLDAVWQLVGFFLGWRGNPGHGRALGTGDVKFFGEVFKPANRRPRPQLEVRFQNPLTLLQLTASQLDIITTPVRHNLGSSHPALSHQENSIHFFSLLPRFQVGPADS